MSAGHPQTRIPIQRLNDAAQARRAPWDQFDWASPIDATRPFICDTLTPLFYAPFFSRLTPQQRLRYNQIVALSFNEIIAFFEESLAGTVLTTLSRHRLAPVALRASLAGFQAEESEHTAIFRKLNLLAAPAWYQLRDDPIVRFPSALRHAIRLIGRQPTFFPFILWVMLAMEERSLEMSRRNAALPPERIEPHFAAVYRAHMGDEARHVQLDWHMIDTFYSRLSRPMRQLNARLFLYCVRAFLLTPRTAGLRVLQALAAEFPDLAPHVPLMNLQLAALAGNLPFQSTMFSPSATGLTFRLMDQFPEFHILGQTLMAYHPGATLEVA